VQILKTSSCLATRTPRERVLQLLSLLAMIAVAISAHAQSYVYINNQRPLNQISAYSVSGTGALTETAGSPYMTGGVGSTGTCFGLDRVVVSLPAMMLFVSNSGDQTISVFQINPADGTLTAAAGSPVPSNLALDSCGGISLAVTPDGKFLMASSSGQISTFNIAANGVLTLASITNNCCSPTVGMKISANGKFLALSNVSSVSTYQVNADGSLTAVINSPFVQTGSGAISGIEFNCASNQLFAAESAFNANTIIDAWTMDGTGALTAVAGSPFIVQGGNSNNLAISPDDAKLYSTDQQGSSIDGSSIASTGVLANFGKFGGVSKLHTPAGVAVDATGSFLFAADDPFGIAVFGLDQVGNLTPLSDTEFAFPGEVQGLAVFPPKSCTVNDLTLVETAASTSVSAGATVDLTFAVTNHGPQSATPATVRYFLPNGLTFVKCSAPAGAFCSAAFANPHIITFSSLPIGVEQDVTVTVQVDANAINGTGLAVTSVISNMGSADPNLGDNSSSVTLTVAANTGPTMITVAPASGNYGGSATITAILQNATTKALAAGKLITFTLNGTAVGSATTNASGQAVLTVPLGALALGTYPTAIGASFAGDTLLNASTGTGSLTVNPGILTVSSSSASFVYGSGATPTYTSTITGFVNGDTSAVVSGTAICAPSATATAVGTYPVTCNLVGLSAANYTFVTNPGTLTITPAALTVTAANVSRVYGAANPPLTGTITGLIGTDVVRATYTSQAESVSPVGAYPIVPFVLPDAVSANYTITYVRGTLTVTTANLTVTVVNATRFYGDPNPNFNAIFTGANPLDNLTASFTTPANALSVPGVYPVTAAVIDPFQRLANYAVTIVPGTLTVTKAPLIVSATNLTKVSGTPNPVLTGTLNKVRNGENITATFSTTAITTSPVGTYPIVPTLVDPNGALVNYVVTIINGTLTIQPATLTVTIANASRIYGDPNPAFTGTISGLQNGDVITATYSSVNPTAAVGTYPITPTFNDPGNVLGNYSVVVVGGTLTINKATLSVSAVGGSRIYGASNPAASVVGLKNSDPITVSYATPTVNSPVGNYTLTPILVDPTSKLPNYTVTIRSAALAITKAPLSIAANNATVVLNTASPAFTATYTGLAGTDTPANLTGTLKCAATVNTVGAHTITCGGQTSNNYAVTFVNGVATVVFANLGACTAGPGHQILPPIATDGSTVFTKATTPSIPVTFRVCDANGAAVNGNVVTSFTLLQQITGGVTTTLNQKQTAAFTFSVAAQDDVATLSTSTPTNLTAGTTYLYQIKMIDNSTINFQFSTN
jgi:6-phosphogluconolactonase (cycloisomerase 2 family)